MEFGLIEVIWFFVKVFLVIFPIYLSIMFLTMVISLIGFVPLKINSSLFFVYVIFCYIFFLYFFGFIGAYYYELYQLYKLFKFSSVIIYILCLFGTFWLFNSFNPLVKETKSELEEKKFYASKVENATLQLKVSILSSVWMIPFSFLLFTFFPKWAGKIYGVYPELISRLFM